MLTVKSEWVWSTWVMPNIEYIDPIISISLIFKFPMNYFTKFYIFNNHFIFNGCNNETSLQYIIFLLPEDTISPERRPQKPIIWVTTIRNNISILIIHALDLSNCNLNDRIVPNVVFFCVNIFFYKKLEKIAFHKIWRKFG